MILLLRERSFSLFVSYLLESTSKTELEAMFCRGGQIVDKVILWNRSSNKSRGFAFVRSATSREAEKALDFYQLVDLGVIVRCGLTCPRVELINQVFNLICTPSQRKEHLPRIVQILEPWIGNGLLRAHPLVVQILGILWIQGTLRKEWLLDSR